MEPRTIARLMAAGRVVIGAGLVVAPKAVSAGWIGDDAGRPGTTVMAAGLGARDVALGAGLLQALSSGDPRPWLAGAVVSDLGDLVATLRARDGIPKLGLVSITAIAGTATVLGAWLTAQDDW